jgi:hypothetical protein
LVHALPPLTLLSWYMHFHHSRSCLGTFTSIKSGGVKLIFFIMLRNIDASRDWITCRSPYFFNLFFYHLIGSQQHLYVVSFFNWQLLNLQIEIQSIRCVLQIISEVILIVSHEKLFYQPNIKWYSNGLSDIT